MRKFSTKEVQKLFQEGQLSAVAELCQKKLDELRSSNDSFYEDIASVLDDMSRAYFEMGEYASAIECTTEILRLDREHAGEVNDNYARNLSNLGLLYRRVGRDAEAEIALKRAMEIVKSLPKDEQQELATALVNLSYVERDKKDYTTAEDLLLQAAKLGLSVYGENVPRFGIIYKH